MVRREWCAESIDAQVSACAVKGHTSMHSCRVGIYEFLRAFEVAPPQLMAWRRPSFSESSADGAR